MEPNGVGFVPILQGKGPAISPKGKKEITFKPLEDGDKPHPYIGSCSAIFKKDGRTLLRGTNDTSICIFQTDTFMYLLPFCIIYDFLARCYDIMVFSIY